MFNFLVHWNFANLQLGGVEWVKWSGGWWVVEERCSGRDDFHRFRAWSGLFWMDGDHIDAVLAETVRFAQHTERHSIPSSCRPTCSTNKTINELRVRRELPDNARAPTSILHIWHVGGCKNNQHRTLRGWVS